MSSPTEHYKHTQQSAERHISNEGKINYHESSLPFKNSAKSGFIPSKYNMFSLQRQGSRSSQRINKRERAMKKKGYGAEWV